MNKRIYFPIFATFLCLYALPAKADNIAANTARMQAMDKITGRVSEIDVPVGGLANFGTFSILVRKCVTKSPEEAPENTAFVDVVDNYQTDNPVNIFKGWMFSSTPALNAVEHPIYDIWLLKCYNRPQDRAKLLSDEQLALRDTIPMSRPDTIVPQADLDLEGFDLEDENSPETTVKDTPQDETTPSSEAIFPAQTGEKPQALSINLTLTDNGNNDDLTITEEDFVSEGEEPAAAIEIIPEISSPSPDDTLVIEE